MPKSHIAMGALLGALLCALPAELWLAPALKAKTKVEAQGKNSNATITRGQCFIIEKGGSLTPCPPDKASELSKIPTAGENVTVRRYLPCAISDAAGTRPCTNDELLKSYNDAYDRWEASQEPTFDGYQYGRKRPIKRRM